MDLNQIIEFIGNHPLLCVALVVILGLLVSNELRLRLSKVKQVEPGEATQLLNHANAIMVDMRNDKDYRDGHIINAVHAPPEGAVGKLDKFRGRPLIVYCRSGQQSVRLAGELVKQGHEDVYNLKGGIQAWQQANLPVSKGK